MDDEGQDLFEQLIKALGEHRRCEITASEDDPSQACDEIDGAGDDILDLQRPKNLKELKFLLDHELDPGQLSHEEREERVIAMICVLGVASITASALTGNAAILIAILPFLYHLFRSIM